ncbi:MAG: hypothetical protein WC861_03020 [Candidatus Micrarchaeia archaeon]|jgi:hypothetical protein
MKPTGKETYKIISAMLEMKKFTQYQISKERGVTFSLVNRVVNSFVSLGCVAKRTGYYELVSAPAIFGIFPIYRKLKPFATFNVELNKEQVLELAGKNAVLCLTSALANYDDYYRDPSIHLYSSDERFLKEIINLRKGYTHIELYLDDMHGNGIAKKNGQAVTDKVRTVVDLFCNNKAYVAERLVKREWMSNEGAVLTGHHRAKPQRA